MFLRIFGRCQRSHEIGALLLERFNLALEVATG